MTLMPLYPVSSGIQSESVSQPSPESSARPRIVLFKTPASTSPSKNRNIEQDPYHSAFHQSGWDARLIPVLDEVFTTDELEDLLRGAESGDIREGLTGVIITSKRGAEGWVQAMRSVISSNAVELESEGSRKADKGKGKQVVDQLGQSSSVKLGHRSG